MTQVEYSRGDEAETLCKACGLCCTGHLFSWVQIKASERSRLQSLGLELIQPSQKQHGFTQPCPMWDGECSIYHDRAYPSGCQAFNCKLLRELLNESISLSKALRVVKQAQTKIELIEPSLPLSSQVSFRDRIVAGLSHLKESKQHTPAELELQKHITSLLDELEEQFGVRNFVDLPEAKPDA